MAFEIVPIPSETNRLPIPCVIVSPANTSSSRGYIHLYHGITRLPFAAESLAAIYEDRAGLQHLADFHERTIVAPLLCASFGIDSFVDPAAVKYADFLARELPREVEALHGRPAARTDRLLVGFSKGGYAAIAALCRAPETFAVAVSRGGALDPAHTVVDLHWDNAFKSEAVFGPYWENQARYHRHSALALINRLANRDDVAIGVEVGLDDFLLKTHRRFHDRLIETRVPHSYTEMTGGHTIDTTDLTSLLATAQRLALGIEARARAKPR